MKFIEALFILIFYSTALHSQTLKTENLNLLVGNWNGTLTYLDYKSGKPFTMPAKVEIEKLDDFNFQIAYNYPTEPKANSLDTFKISSNGKIFNGSKITKILHLLNKGIKITTEKIAVDGNDNKKAILKHIYTITISTFINRKEVKFLSSNVWLLRNEYKFSK